MLYTFSKAHYATQELQALLTQVSENDAIVLWQDGVLQAVKNPQFFANQRIFALDNDVQARGLNHYIPEYIQRISFDEFVSLTEQFYPQIAF